MTQSHERIVPAPALSPALRRSTMSRFGLGESDIGQLVHSDSVCQGVLLAPAFRYVGQRAVSPSAFDVYTTEKDTRFLTRNGVGEFSTLQGDIERIAALDVYGHAGVSLADHDEIFKAAVETPEILGGWHLPPLELVNGIYASLRGAREDVGETVAKDQPDHFVSHMGRGALRDSFEIACRVVSRLDSKKMGFSNCYFTASRGDAGGSLFYGVHLSESKQKTQGIESLGHSDSDLGSSRPVRAVLRPS